MKNDLILNSSEFKTIMTISMIIGSFLAIKSMFEDKTNESVCIDMNNIQNILKR